MLGTRALPTLKAICAAAALTLISGAARAVVIYTVTNTNDGGAGSLRQAILDANGSPGSDLIQFAIPGAGVHTILTMAPLPVTETVLIDGYSQPGSVWNTDPLGDNAVLQVELFGQGTDGLVITGGATIIQGFSLYGFQTAIALSGTFGSLIQGNFIGVAADGTASGNVVGISVTGTDGLDRIGDNYPAARNLISANSSTGILLSGGSGKRIFGNLIGTDMTGSGAAPNGVGIQVTDSDDAVIGGVTVGHRNVISGNTTSGVAMTGGDADAVLGCFIGTTAAGTSPLPNGGDGVRVEGNAENFVIFFNVISGNASDGVHLEYTTPVPGVSQNLVGTNVIGLDLGGSIVMGNGAAGIRIASGGSLIINNDYISGNRVGVWRVAPSILDSVLITANQIYGNRGRGIVLGAAEEIAPNTPNSPFNFPLITSVVLGAGDVTVDGIYGGPADHDVNLEFFANPPCPAVRPGDFWEGRQSLGGMTVHTDGTGHAAFHVVFLETLNNDAVTATATVPIELNLREGGAVISQQTSEFSQRLPFSIAPDSGTPAGGEALTIQGTDFHVGAAVTIGGLTPANVVVVDDRTITADAPAFAAGSAGDVVVTNTDGTHGTLALGWFTDFLDVPPSHPFHDFIVRLVSNSVASGVGAGNFGAAADTLRQQMAVFLLKARHGICYTPPPCQTVFTDVPCPSAFADWIEALYQEGITGGCGPGLFCPGNPVLRQQMAVFLLKAEHGPGYVPPGCVGIFGDVPCGTPFADWIERLAAENITGGCGGGNYCPTTATNRGQMAVFLVKTFLLP